MAGIQDYQAREHLLNVLKERGIPLGSDDISWAFASTKTRDQSIAWVKEYLQDVTLLSKDELDLLEKSVVNPTDARADQIVLSDASLKAAIESMQVSSAMIDKHAQALEAQRDALQAFRESSRNDAMSHQLESPKKTLGNDISRASITFEESLYTLTENFADADKQSSGAMNALNSLVVKRLRADDEVVQALSSLASKTSPSQPGGIHPATIDQWCQALMMLRESETNSRIDTTINDSICEQLESPEPITNGSHDHTSSIEALESEIQTLRDEIPSVVELVISSELRQPLERLMSNSRQTAITSQTQWIHYILDTFQHMINQLHLISDQTTKLHSYTTALAQIREAFQSVKRDSSAIVAGAQPTIISGPSRPMHSRSNSRAALPVTSGSLAEQTCKRFSIARATLDVLQAAAEDSVNKMLEQYISAADTTDELVGQAMNEQTRNIQGTLGQVYAHSQFSSVQLLPKDLENEVNALDKAISATVVGLESAEKGKHDNIKEVVAQVRAKFKS